MSLARPARWAARLNETIRVPPLAGATSTSGRRGSMVASADAPDAGTLNRRAIGHAFNHTETMRDMVPLDKPLACTSVAAALQCRGPARARENPEAIAGGRSGDDAPARRRGACADGNGTAQQHERRGTRRGGKIEAAADRQIEIEAARDGAGDHGEVRGRSERLLECPQRVLVVPRLDDDETAGIKTPLDEARAIRHAEIHAAARLEDEHGGPWTPMECQRQQSQCETEGCRRMAMGFRGNFVERAAWKARPWQMGMHHVRTQRQIRA